METLKVFVKENKVIKSKVKKLQKTKATLQYRLACLGEKNPSRSFDKVGRDELWDEICCLCEICEDTFQILSHVS